MPKNIYKSPYRSYRLDTTNRENEQKIQIIIEETDLLITLTNEINKEEIIDFCTKEIQEQRNILKFWINLYPEIKNSLDPIQTPQNAPIIIKALCEAGKFAHVGPFAGVAGTIAQFIATKIHSYLKEKNICSDVIVENGGDIYAFSSKERYIGILANPKEQCMVGIKLAKEQFPLAICASSATIGHSLSFGQGDLALILAKNASLADALATRYGNLLRTKQDINHILTQAKQDYHIKMTDNPFTEQTEKSGLSGVFLQIDENIGAWGEIELTAIH
jgi:hypothetical protein